MLEEDLRTKIADDSGVSALVAKPSINWGDRPQASAMPGITLDIIFDGRPQHMQGFVAVRGTQIQADCWSLDRIEARNIREALIPAVVPPAIVGDTNFRRGFIDREDSSFEKTDDGAIVYRERVDLTIWHSTVA